uniref:WD_REPEATS_REGION domain-containing protein n=1 Tax=Heterorhabditis bacteriophora TaxID=37862 RepID=A0A1I7XER4_HETBA
MFMNWEQSNQTGKVLNTKHLTLLFSFFSCSRTLWPSWSPPFTYSQSSPTDDDLSNLTNALCVCEDTGYIYTGDSHGGLRRWNIERAPLCEYISGSRRTDGRSPYRIAYNEAEPTRDLPATIYELRVPNKESVTRVPAAVDGKVYLFSLLLFPSLIHKNIQSSTCHRAPISDLLCIQGDLLASASADGKYVINFMIEKRIPYHIILVVYSGPRPVRHAVTQQMTR